MYDRIRFLKQHNTTEEFFKGIPPDDGGTDVENLQQLDGNRTIKKKK